MIPPTVPEFSVGYVLLQSIMEYNGAAIVAMIGKDCVAIAADKRLGVQAQTVSFDFQKIIQMSDKLFVGLPGLATDVQTVYVSVTRSPLYYNTL